ncbi:replication protein P [Marinimicrobium alkaliphilum]|uniref:replication protein P n=1 Tax=Marinimicrobium alkaliphilum TaxID=2202654 RepID=UPI000DB9CE8F|nr:replication protein P [Marinimicrobium alkaliphilum]
MQDSKPLIDQVTRAIAASSRTSPTAAGPAEQPRPKPTDGHIDAINEAFALFRINYHNQYYKAYSDEQTLAQIKRLWLDSLSQFEPDSIRRGARKVIETSDYLPTLNRMIRACQGDPESYGLPDAHRAYVEACQAPSPKAAYSWSHPAVYHAGVASDWFFLTSSPERAAFPVFERNYRRLCEQVMNGAQLPVPDAPALPEHIDTPLSKAENQKRLDALRRELDL